MSRFKFTNFIPLDTQIETTESPRWEFEYGDKDDIQGFDCHLKCMQCMAKTGERRCRRKTCYTAPLCWQHLKNLAHLRIGRTTLVDPSTGERFKFLGLFACNSKKPGEVVFRKRDPIVPYIGEKKTFDDIERVYNREGNEDATVPYGEVTEVPGGDDIVIDGACFRGWPLWPMMRFRVRCVKVGGRVNAEPTAISFRVMETIPSWWHPGTFEMGMKFLFPTGKNIGRGNTNLTEPNPIGSMRN